MPDLTDSQMLADTDESFAGLGVDIIEIERMERAFDHVPTMKTRLFTAQECAYAEGKARPIVHFALFFAAKEAVLKSLGTGFRGTGWTDVEVTHDRFGRPLPVLKGVAEARALELGVVEVQLSLSYTHQVAVASAVAIKDQDRPHQDEKINPKTELLHQFKELRGLLDDMDLRLKALEPESIPPSAGESEP